MSSDEDDNYRFKYQNSLVLDHDAHFQEWPEWIQMEANVGAWTFNIETQEVWWSSQVLKIYEVEKGPIADSRKYFGEKGTEKFTDLMTKAITNSEGWDIILPFLSENKNEKWVRSTGHVVEDNGKRVIHGTFQDLTSWYSALKSFEELVKSSPDFILRIDNNRRIAFVNKSIPEKDPSDFIGLDFLELVPEENKEIARKKFEECIRKKKVVSYESQGNTEYDKDEWYSNRMQPVVLDDEVHFVNMTVSNITESKEIQRREFEQKAINEHQSRLALVGELSASIVETVP